MLIVFAFACQRTPEQSKVPEKEDVNLLVLEDNDAEMNEAIETARSSVSQLADAIRSGDPRYSLFALKVRFPAQRGGTEHLWIRCHQAGQPAATAIGGLSP